MSFLAHHHEFQNLESDREHFSHQITLTVENVL